MRDGWKVVIIIVLIAVIIGAVSAGVGFLTGADSVRIGGVLEDRIAEQFNVDANAFVHEWIPESVEIILDSLK